MINMTISRQTPEIEDIFSNEIQGCDGLEQGICAQSGPGGRQTPDLGEIFQPDDRDAGRRTPEHECVAEN